MTAAKPLQHARGRGETVLSWACEETDEAFTEMHYLASRGSPLLPRRERPTIRDRVESKVIPEVPSDSWHDADRPLPLQVDTSPWTIAAECLPFCTGEPRTNAVYVLECIPNDEYRETAARKLGRVDKPWNGRVEGADRLIYVGMTINLHRRLWEHVNEPNNAIDGADGDGAHFTTVFPPVRVLHVSWWPSFETAMEAEEIAAKLLRDRFPDDYVYQA